MKNHFIRTTERYNGTLQKINLMFTGFAVLVFWLTSLTLAHAAEPRPEDILHTDDFETRKIGYEMHAGHNSLVIQAVARNKSVANSLGYAQIRAWYDTVDQLTRKIVLLDEKGNMLSTVLFSGLSRIKGRKSATQMKVTNHRTGQTCYFKMSNKLKPVYFM